MAVEVGGKWGCGADADGCLGWTAAAAGRAVGVAKVSRSGREGVSAGSDSLAAVVGAVQLLGGDYFASSA